MEEISLKQVMRKRAWSLLNYGENSWKKGNIPAYLEFGKKNVILTKEA